MRMDPRRRFTLGMTFAETTVRLWHYNREVLVVSEAFDFNKVCHDHSLLDNSEAYHRTSKS